MNSLRASPPTSVSPLEARLHPRQHPVVTPLCDPAVSPAMVRGLNVGGGVVILLESQSQWLLIRHGSINIVPASIGLKATDNLALKSSGFTSCLRAQAQT